MIANCDAALLDDGDAANESIDDLMADLPCNELAAADNAEITNGIDGVDGK